VQWFSPAPIDFDLLGQLRPAMRIASGCRAENRAWSWTKQQGCRRDKVLTTLQCPGGSVGARGFGMWKVIQQIIEESGWKWAKMALNEILSSTFNHFHRTKQMDFLNFRFQTSPLHQILVIFIHSDFWTIILSWFSIGFQYPGRYTPKESSTER